MTTPNPQPRNPSSGPTQNSWTGWNSKGSGQKYKGKFQWGHGQYGYINPQGTINWAAKAPTDKQNLMGAKPAMKWAQQSGQVAKRTDPYGMPVSAKVKPPGYLDPQYGVAAAQLTGERAMQQRQLANQLSELKARYGLESGQFEDEYARSRDALGASLGSRGFSQSGVAGREITDAEQGYARGLESIQQQFGAPAQERIQATQRLIDSNLRAQLQAQQKTAKERFKAENEYRLAQGLEPRSLGTPQKGFHKKGSTWFYTNPQGVEVSVQGNPYQRQVSAVQKMIKVEKAKQNPREDKIASWQKRIEQLKGKM
jgi:hypothetical protein